MFLVAIAQSGVAVEDKAEGLIEVGIVEVGLDGLGYYQKQGADEKHWDWGSGESNDRCGAVDCG